MSIAMPAIAVLEAIVISGLLFVVTRRRPQTSIEGINPPNLYKHQHDTPSTGMVAAHALPTKAPSQESLIRLNGKLNSPSAHRPLGVPLRTIASARAIRRHAFDSGTATASTRSLHADTTMRTGRAPEFCAVSPYLPFAILLLDERGRIASANASTARLFGYEDDELTGAPVDALVPELHAERCLSLQAEAFALRDTRSVTPMHELSARRKGGGEFRVEIGFHAFRPDQGLTLAFIVDRTDRYELLRNRLDVAHLARVSTMGQLASSLAHEINQPLTAILSNVQAAQRFMAAEPADLAEVREILEDIVQDDYRASEVIRRIRAVVKKGDLEVALLDLTAVIRDVIHLVQSDAIVRGTHVTLDLEGDLPGVRGDKVQLQQVMLNLLLNAFDAMKDVPAPDRVVAVTLRSHSNDTVCISVRDGGCGLTADKLDKIFKPFFTSKPQGLGLGLSISRTIIDMHRGRLWAEDNLDGGATFHITLPVEVVTSQQEPGRAS
ncbi:two-component system sensor kinase FixL [Paraburkholderia sp. GAS41]|uniref:sensor histidine kinase n=1 Tax=Paraburkholderia sp. GAS41 TaxID=3035134 RepID=UPI003D20FDB3